MAVSYKKIASVTIKNDFYINGLGVRDFEIVPTEDTESKLRGFNMLARVTDNGLTLLIKIDPATSTAPFAPFVDPTNTVLRFVLRQRNSVLSNFSLLPLTGNSGKIVNFDNLIDNTTGSDKLLHPEVVTDTSLNDLSYTLRGEVISRSSTETVRIEDVFGNIYGTTFDQLEIDLRPLRLAGGRYKIVKTSDDSVVEEFYLNKDLGVNDAFGVIDLHIRDGVVPATYELVQVSGSDVTFPADGIDFVVGLKKRAVVWKYIVEVRDNPDILGKFSGSPTEITELTLSGLTTTDPDGHAQVIENTDQRKAVQFISSAEVPYEEQKNTGIQLIFTDGGPPKTIVNTMPNASVNSMKPGSTNESQIYVYV